MKDEIKKAIDNLNGVVKGIYRMDESGLEIKNIEIILDYITNLQERNEKLKELKNLYREKLISKFCTNKRAIEYIKEHIKYECDDTINGMSFYSYHLYDFRKDDLLNILQGEDNTIQENLYKYTPEKGFRLVGDEDE